MKTEILFCWLGTTDLKAAAGQDEVGLGPIAQAVVEKNFHIVILLNNWNKNLAEDFIAWLNQKTSYS